MWHRFNVILSRAIVLSARNGLNSQSPHIWTARTIRLTGDTLLLGLERGTEWWCEPINGYNIILLFVVVYFGRPSIGRRQRCRAIKRRTLSATATSCGWLFFSTPGSHCVWQSEPRRSRRRKNWASFAPVDSFVGGRHCSARLGSSDDCWKC